MKQLFELKEKDVTKQVLDYLQLMHIPYWRMNVGLRSFANKDGTTRYVHFGEKGMPDYLLAIKINGGWHLGWLELKRAKGKLSPEQEEFKQYTEEQGMCYVLARSVEDVQEGIQAYKKRFS